MTNRSRAFTGPTRWASLLLVLGAGIASGGLFGPSGDSVDAKRAAILKQRDDILKEAITAKPALKDSIQRSAGYATFRQTDVNLFLLASGNGYGVLVDSRSGKETFMRMASVGGGVGMGVKDLRFLLVFQDPEALRVFLEQGWQVGGKADASAKYQNTGVSADQSVKAQLDLQKGNVAVAGSADARAGADKQGAGKVGASSVGAGVEVYQFTESGISLQAMIQGTKFWKDSKLNP
jgi:lipid-binding SYLF domain-containing protein